MRKIDLNNFQVATSETARDINRRIVLNLIRKLQPVSRADLSRQSGLQRSTVSAIAEQLISEKWVIEGALGQLPRGRKPTFLHINSERAGVIGIDVRPKLTTIALATLDSRFIAQQTLVTGDDPAVFISELTDRLKRLMAEHSEITYEGIGIALPGRIDTHTSRLTFAPNLGWHSVDLKTPLEEATGLSVELENAANACALAELWNEKHSETARNLAAVTVSEGIGVGLILNGQLVRGSSGLAGEFGHVTIDDDGPLCKCGNRGCWEVCASNTAAVRYYFEATASTRTTSRNGGLSFEDLLRLMEQGDVKAIEALNRMAKHLGQGLAMLFTGLTPDVVVLVGSVTRAWDQIGPVVTGEVKRRLPTDARIRIVPTDPEMQPRLRGTISLVMQKHFGFSMFL